MKKYCFLFVFLVAALSLRAQIVGDVAVTRKVLAEIVGIEWRYLANIENKGQHPSLQIFFELVTRYHISVDQLLFGDATESKSTARRQLDPLLDEMTEAELKIIIATAQAILDARAEEEK